MGAQVLEFVSAHGTLFVLATTLLAAIGIVQWRKVHVAELDCDFKEGLLQQGLSVAEIIELLHAKAATRAGLLEQFGALSGGAKTGLILAVVMTVPGSLGMIIGALESHDSRSRFHPHPFHEHPFPQPPVPRDSQPLRFALTPERPIVFLDEAGTASCRIYLTDGYPVYDLQMVAAVSGQDNTEGELRVETTPGVVPRAEGSNGRRYCDVRLQAVRGGGHFTVQVTVADKYRQRAQTTFSVQVGKPQQTAPPANHGDDDSHPSNLGLTSAL